MGVDRNDWLDEDNDGLATFVEEWIGTDPDDPDSDHDGIIDGLEDRNGNGIQDPMETLALVADSDGDGLLDGEEDRNGTGHGRRRDLAAASGYRR